VVTVVVQGRSGATGGGGFLTGEGGVVAETGEEVISCWASCFSSSSGPLSSFRLTKGR
jgi:hypothetical protein